MGIFFVHISGSFPCEIPGDISTWKFPSCFPQKNFKMQFNDIGSDPVIWKYPSDDLMSLFGESKCVRVWEPLSHFNHVLKISPGFPRGLSFDLKPKFPHRFPPSTTTIPRDSPPNPQHFARWVDSTSTHLCFLSFDFEDFLAMIFSWLSKFQTRLILLCKESLLGVLHGHLPEFA